MPTADSTSRFREHFTVDVRCTTKDGHHFLVEMQNDFRDDYQLKALLEHSRMVRQLDIDQTEVDRNKRAEKNKKEATHFWKGIQGIYTIVITNKVFDSRWMKLLAYPAEKIMEPMLGNPYELRYIIEQLDRRYGDVPNRIVLLMLDHLNKSVTELKTPIEEWAYVLKDRTLRSDEEILIPETKELEDIELIANRNPGIREFIELLDVDNLPNEVRDRHMRAIRYFNATILDIEKKAFERGVLAGWHRKVVRAMKKIGKQTDAEIAVALDLTEAYVAGIKIE